MKEHGSAPQHLLVGRWPSIRHSFYTCHWMDFLSGLFTWIYIPLVLGQLKISSYQSEIEICRYGRKPLEEWICQLLHWGWKRTTLCLTLWYLLWNKREILLSYPIRLWPTTQDHEIWWPTVLGTVLARTQET